MSTPLRELRERRVAPLSKQGGRDDNDIDAKRSAAEHTAATAASGIARTESARRARAAKPRSSAWRAAARSALDARADAASRRTCSAIDERTIFAGYGATRAISASAASAESSRRANAASRTSLIPLLGGAVRPNTPPPTPQPAWRRALATQTVLAQRRPKRPLSRMRAIERLEWQLEELLVNDKRRITRHHLMTLIMDLPITMADAEYIWSGGTRTDKVLDRVFELMGEDCNDRMHAGRAIRR